jgi:hypothetical protein
VRRHNARRNGVCFGALGVGLSANKEREQPL